jgi:formylglycine-generating enzyme required for sulfatase activity
MTGNVMEWTEDDWHVVYTGAPNDGSAWIDNPRGTRRVMRGGNYYDAILRAAARFGNDPSTIYSFYLGFRLARSAR